ncbi:hypothetical protein [Saccharothrix deserti]|uniref:hypothetical protein n=1 Tax=Saccharothrix deserti TaxID=2593674 RepID=UPI00131BAD74|nr:hypothetical protein [Saccharothrix deserti]
MSGDNPETPDSTPPGTPPESPPRAGDVMVEDADQEESDSSEARSSGAGDVMTSSVDAKGEEESTEEQERGAGSAMVEAADDQAEVESEVPASSVEEDTSDDGARTPEEPPREVVEGADDPAVVEDDDEVPPEPAEPAAADRIGEEDKPHAGALKAEHEEFQEHYYLREGEPVRRDAYAQDADGNRIPRMSSGEGDWYVPVDSDVQRASFKGDVERYSATEEDKERFQAVVDDRGEALAALREAKADPDTPDDVLKDAYTSVRDIGEELGHQAGKLAVENVYGGEGVTITPLHEEGERGAGRFDQMWKVTDQEQNDRFVVVECKGGDGPLGTRLDNGTSHEQGTPEYFDSIQRAMLSRPAEVGVAIDLALARNAGAVDFILVRASTVEGGHGAEFGGYSLRRFDLDRHGSDS